MNREEKIIVAAISALSRIDPKVLALGIVRAAHAGLADKGKPMPATRKRVPEQYRQVQAALAALGMMQDLMEHLEKFNADQRARKESEKEVKDSSFSAEDQARAAEILAAFMERSGVHIKGES
jgi:hypothetical protein